VKREKYSLHIHRRDKIPMEPPFNVKKSSSPLTHHVERGDLLLESDCCPEKFELGLRPPVSSFTAAHISERRLCSGLSEGWLWNCSQLEVRSLRGAGH